MTYSEKYPYFIVSVEYSDLDVTSENYAVSVKYSDGLTTQVQNPDKINAIHAQLADQVNALALGEKITCAASRPILSSDPKHWAELFDRNVIKTEREINLDTMTDWFTRAIKAGFDQAEMMYTVGAGRWDHRSVHILG